MELNVISHMKIFLWYFLYKTFSTTGPARVRTIVRKIGDNARHPKGKVDSLEFFVVWKIIFKGPVVNHGVNPAPPSDRSLRTEAHQTHASEPNINEVSRSRGSQIIPQHRHQ
jgi:hypothetical protein